MRVLVTGENGLLGRWVARVFAETGYSMYATYHSHRPEGSEAQRVYLDSADLATVPDMVKGVDPDAMVHAAAYTDVDRCELKRDFAYSVNYSATRALAKAAGGGASSSTYPLTTSSTESASYIRRAMCLAQ